MITAKAICLLSALAAQTAVAEATSTEWHRDLDQAAALAAREDKPLFVVFRCER